MAGAGDQVNQMEEGHREFFRLWYKHIKKWKVLEKVMRHGE